MVIVVIPCKQRSNVQDILSLFFAHFLKLKSAKTEIVLHLGSMVNRDQKIGAKIEHKLFSQTFRATPGYPGKIQGSPAKNFNFPGFEGHTELFGPHPFTWKTPIPPENVRTEKFGFGFLFRA